MIPILRLMTINVLTMAHMTSLSSDDWLIIATEKNKNKKHADQPSFFCWQSMQDWPCAM